MTWRAVLVLVCLATLVGCIRPVTIPQQEAELKSACRGKDRALASRGGLTVYRCGEGDQAKYAAYVNGELTKEGNEVVALGAVAEIECANSGFKAGTPEYTLCAQKFHSSLRNAAANLRDRENAAAEVREQRAWEGLAAASATLQAGQAQIQASQPQFTQPTTSMFAQRVRCNSYRFGNSIQTDCN